MAVLVTGGAGFIGSHTVIQLLQQHYEVVVLDNLSNATVEVFNRIETITGQRVHFYQADIRDRAVLQQIFATHTIEYVLHFAGLKAVGESVQQPLRYYDNNVTGSLILVEEMCRAGVFRLVFSSSATVYGDPATVPITEDMPTGATTNPYGTSKHIVERMLTDIQAADDRWCITLLRYFNPIGAHPSGLIGENPNGIPNNLLPYIGQVAVGKLSQLAIFGNDYATADGTGVRDYIHVMDLADGHLCAMQHTTAGLYVYNLGTGQGYSVLEIVHAFEQASQQIIPYQIVARREGDIAQCYADASRAARELNWQAKYDLPQMMLDAWHWQQRNPNGYQPT